MKTYRKLTTEEKIKTFHNYQELCEKNDYLYKYEDFEQYDAEQLKLDFVFDEDTLECLG